MAARKKADSGVTPELLDDMDKEAFEAAAAEMDAAVDAEPALDEQDAAPEPTLTEPASEPVAEAKADDADPEDAEFAGSDTVPHGRFHNERERRKTAEQNAERAQKRMDDILGIMQANQKGDTKPDEAAKPENWVDPRKDIFGAYEQLRRGYENIVGHTNQKIQETEQGRQRREVIEEGDNDIIGYIKEAPDAEGAMAFLRNTRVAELNAMGFTDPNQQREDLLNLQMQVTGIARQRGVRVGKMLHEMATARGYKPTGAAPQSGNGAAATIASVAALEATKQRSQSLGGSGAPVNLGELSSKDILELSDKDYAKLKTTLEKQGKDIMELGFAGTQ